LAELERRLDRALDALLDTDAPTAAMKAKARALEAERDEVAAALAQCDADQDAQPVELHPDAPRRWAETVEQLQHVLETAASDPEALDRTALDLVRSLIERIEILPESDAKNAPIDLVLHGRLAEILDLEQTQTRPLGNWGSVGSWGRDRTADLRVMNPPL
jgi:thioesterase domain-containing protein